MDVLSGVRFSTVITNSNYIVRDHRVHGVRMMPGVTLLDMIYRFLQTKGFRLPDIELRRVLFSEPVTTSGHYDKKIQISFTAQTEGYEVVAQSQKVKEGRVLDSAWDENLRCELHVRPVPSAERRTIDIGQIKSRSTRVEDMDHAYSYVRRIDIRHLEFMKGLGKLYYGSQRILAEISLGGLAKQYMDHFYMHPCYLDAATLVQGFVVLQELDFSREIQASIPMFIESFRSWEPMKERIYVYIKDEGYPDGEIRDLMYFDIEVYNEQGEEIASFRRWGLKKIRSRELISGSRKDQSPVLLPVASTGTAQLKPEHAVSPVPVPPGSGGSQEGDRVRKETIVSYLKGLISTLSGVDPAELQNGEGFYNQGLNSQHLLDIVRQLEERLGSNLYPTLLFEYANIEELSGYILREHGAAFFPAVPLPEKALSSAEYEAAATETSAGHAVHAYSPAWTGSPLRNHGAAGRWPGQEQILVLCSPQDELLQLKGTEAGKRFSFVFAGEAFSAEGGGIYRLNLTSEDSYKQLIGELMAAGCMPAVVVNTLNCGVQDRAALPELSEHQVLPMFYLLRELLRSKIKTTVKLMYCFDQTDTAAHPGDAAMEGFLECLRSESDKLAYKCIGMDEMSRQKLQTVLQDELYEDWSCGDRIAYELGIRKMKTYRKCGTAEAEAGRTSIRSGHIYLITGGAGGIGRRLAAHVVEQGATAILCGRAASLPEGSLNGLAAHPLLDYVSCNVADRRSVEQLHAYVKAKHGRLDGIVHCAGVTRDSLLVHKDAGDLLQVLRVKADGTAHLDEVFKAEPLAFFAAFSSVAGVLGNPAQSDYAYANMYMDHYMELRERQRVLGTRNGKSLSVNWPLWREGGMKGDRHIEPALNRRFGISLLETDAGIGALEWALGREESLLLLAPGEESRIDSVLIRDGAIVEETAEPLPETALELPHRSGNTGENDLAIIGISGRFPGADNLDEYWELLRTGRDAVSEISPQRWSHEQQQRTARESWGKDCSRWGGFLRDVDKFDPLLFGIAPYQAALMDPHERIFLELAWEAFEDSGYPRSALKGRKVGVFAGAMWMHYQLYNTDRQVATSTLSSVANRVSYCFGLTGPSLAVDTMCSSSLTALHLACQSIRNQDCAMALVGGVNLSVHPDKYLLLSQGNFASSDGRCRSFGEGGDGYVPAEAAGAVLIKPLRQAELDQDRIYAVIKGSSVNHGGEASGFTVPNQRAQEEAVADALRRSGVDPSTINYIEAHGTGTSLGDPIEIQALVNAFTPHQDTPFRTAIGSVKSNIGHAEAAAGMASIAKVILQMQHGQLVPSIHSEEINPHIRLENTGFSIQQKLEDWQPVTRFRDGQMQEFPRRAGISAFGAGGSNAHVILEHYSSGSKNAGARDEREGPYVFVLSAQTSEQLKAYARRMREYITQRQSAGQGQMQEVSAALHMLIEPLLNLPAAGSLEEHSLQELGLGPVEFVQLSERLGACFGIAAHTLALHGDLTIKELGRQLLTGLAEGEELERHASTARPAELPLSRLSYTLQVSREPMKHRLAIVHLTAGELLQALENYLEAKACSRLFTSEDLEGQSGKEQTPDNRTDPWQAAERLARTWTGGGAVDWKALYGKDKPKLLTLPHYPFARKSYWIEAAALSQPMSRIQEPAKTISAMPAVTENAAVYTGNEVVLEYDGQGIALLRIQDAMHNNTFTHEVIQGLIHCFRTISEDEQIKAVVVAGNDRIFSMGGTQEQLLDISDSKLSFTDAPILYRGMLECPVPVISAIEGHASGGGLLFGLYADLVVMAEESVYSAAFAKYGFTPGMGATFILEEKLGKNLAVEMMFTAKMYSGVQLKSRSASVIFQPKDQVLQEAVSIARMIAEKPRTTVSVLKQELSGRVLDSLLRCVERENEMHRITFTTDEVKARIRHLYRADGPEGQAQPAVQATVQPERKQSRPSGQSNQDELVRIIARRIQLDEAELDTEMNFKDMGVDSISGVEIVRDVNESFGLQLDTIDIYDHYSITLLAAHIGRKQAASRHEGEELRVEALTQTEARSAESPDHPAEDRDLLELLSRLEQEELDVDELAQFLEVYYE
ncbi:SDR family NAD(P)-dependent oxidoreductase [Paenibacillus piscarius]|uniref:SDR family NAD(P)-dependent oxidoreductase n=1 Tax=Paenibacillus piscarius TaxID=1089681 RepID=UPI001EE82BC7|nr:SDR family NAD(P)-dependent oxidoreductase [Paenibacillus piscarius]